MITKNEIEQTLLRAAKRWYLDVNDIASEKVGAWTECPQCEGGGYNVYNPYLDDAEVCSICALYDVAEVYTYGDKQDNLPLS